MDIGKYGANGVSALKVVPLENRPEQENVWNHSMKVKPARVMHPKQGYATLVNARVSH